MNRKRLFTARLTSVFWVADGKRTLLDFLFKQVLLIEEEDNGGVCEPLVVADAVKQLHALVHSVLGRKRKVTLGLCASLSDPRRRHERNRSFASTSMTIVIIIHKDKVPAVCEHRVPAIMSCSMSHTAEPLTISSSSASTKS